MFSTPVGGAFLLALLFTGIGLYLLVLLIKDGFTTIFNAFKYGALHTRTQQFLDARDIWIRNECQDDNEPTWEDFHLKKLFSDDDYKRYRDQGIRIRQLTCSHQNKELNRPSSDTEWYCYDCGLVWEGEPEVKKESVHTQTHKFDDIRGY